MTDFEKWALEAGFLIICTLIGMVYKDLKNKITDNHSEIEIRLDAHADDIGRHYSSINDLKVDHRELRTNITNHESKFDEIAGGLEALSDMFREGMNRVNDKLDNMRERRQ